MKRLPFVGIASVALSMLAPANGARAACNAFPGVRLSTVGGFNLSPAAAQVAAADQAARERASAPLLHLAPLGRVDASSFRPGSLVVAATDTTCAGPIYSVPVTPRPSFEARWLDKLVAVVVTRPSDESRPPIARVYAHGGAGHDASRLCGLRAAFADTGIRPLEDCARGTMRTIEVGPGKAALGIPLPTEEELLGAVAAVTPAGEAAKRLNFTVLAMARPESAVELATTVRRIQLEGCVPSCRDFVSPVGARGALCVDQVVNLGWNRFIDRVVYLNGGFPDCDDMSTSLKLGGPENTFKRMCEVDEAGGGLCTDPPTDTSLFMRQDSCGRVHIPFKWDGVYVNTPVVLAGHSATSRKKLGEENRIWVPGREFVGSTPTAKGSYDDAITEWRKPDITVWYPTPTEFGLKGVVDKGTASTVHIFPNYEVKVLCDTPSSSGAPEACEGVDRGVNASVPNCACGDRYGADCTCKIDEPGRYFACVGGDRADMPCTRHDHCNNKDGTPGGLCNGEPACREDGAVYRVDANGPKGDHCTTNIDCSDALPQCGYRLFDLSAQKDTGQTKIQLDRRLKKGEKKRRGACVNAPTASCNNVDQTADPKGCSSGECRGYRLLVTK